MSDLDRRLAALSPEKRRLLERRLAAAGLDPRGERPGGRTIPRRAEGAGPFPLTYGQRRLWFIELLNPGTPAYNIPFAGRLAGPLHAARLEASLVEVVRRHAVLRSRFAADDDGNPVQIVEPLPALRLPLVDLSAIPEDRRTREAARLTDAEPQHPFDLARGPVVRITLVRLGPALHDLLVTMPHIVTDAWSMAVLFRELPVVYDALGAGRPIPLAELPVQVADYALWEREQLAGERLDRELGWWRAHLAGAATVLELPADRPRRPLYRMRGRRHEIALPEAVSERLERFAERSGATSFMVLLAAFGVLLARLSGEDDFLVASPLATRGEPETHALIGFFIDNAALRLDLSGDPTFGELLARVRESALATFAHQGVPFEKVVEALGAGGDLSRPPLAQINFVLQNVHIPAPEFVDLELVSAQQTDTRSARFELSLGLFEEEGGLRGWLEYNTDLFDRATIERWRREYLAIAEAAAGRPDTRLSRLPALAPSARQQLLHEWGERAAAWPERPIHRLVLAHAAAAPDAAALVFTGRDGRSAALSYGELVARAARLAGVLAARGVGPESLVAVAAGRSPERIVALLAVLLAGGAYLPIDPTYPAERQAFMVADARPLAALVGLGAERGPFQAAGVEVIELELQIESGAAPAPRTGEASGPTAFPDVPPDALAYVLYTSGSTGRPKGIAVTHRGVARLVAGGGFAETGPGETFLALTSESFDLSTFEVWGALASGAALALFADETPTLEGLARALVRHRVTTLSLATPLFHLVASERPEILAGVRQAVPAGEALSPAAVAAAVAVAPGLAIVNAYGPTEATVYATAHRMQCPSDLPSAGGGVPIGRPVAGTRVALSDHRLRPVPLGAAGELVAGGAALARGYAGRPVLTAERFVPDPFSGRMGARLYRTGDLARWRPDGRLEFLGRADRQLKVRGYRVEPGEIETVLARHPAVERAIVDLRGGRLIAWVVPVAGGRAVDPAALGGFVARALPAYMVPAAIVTLEAFSLTPAGKIERKALPDPDGEPGAGELPRSSAPASPLEETLAAVFCEVLGRSEIGVHDRFFELGGDSILAIRAVSRAGRAGIRLEPRDLFENPTVAALAAVVAGRPGGAERDLAGEVVTGTVPFGPAERWLLGLAGGVAGGGRMLAHWNMALLLAVAGQLSAGILERAARALVAHHDMLRTRFRHREGEWSQEVAPPGIPVAGPLATAVDLSALPGAGRHREAARVAARLQRGLDLERGPLLRLAAIDCGEGVEDRLALVIHHLVADAVSLRILLDDLGAAYSALAAGDSPALPPRSASFRARIAALAAWARSPQGRAEAGFWRRMLTAPPAVLSRDRPGEPGQTSGAEEPEREGSTARVAVVLAEEETAALLAQGARGLRARLDEIALAGLAIALARRGGDRRIRIEVEGHGRAPHPSGPDLDLSRTVGWLTAFYPLAVERPAEDAGGAAASAQAWLRAVKEALRAVPAGGVGYGALRWLGDAETRAALDPARTPVGPATIGFNFLGAIDEAFDLGGGASGAAGAGGAAGGIPRMSLAAEDPGPTRHPGLPRPLAIEVAAYLAGGRLHLDLAYSRRRHRRRTVDALAEEIRAAVRELVFGAAAAPGAEAEALTATDFPHAGLERDQLARLLEKVGAGSGG